MELEIARGRSPEEARRIARLAMDGLDQQKEECRDMRRMQLVEHLMQDIRYGCRSLMRSPGGVGMAAGPAREPRRSGADAAAGVTVRPIGRCRPRRLCDPVASRRLAPVVGATKLLQYFDEVAPMIRDRHRIEEVRGWFADEGVTDVRRLVDEMALYVMARLA